MHSLGKNLTRLALVAMFAVPSLLVRPSAVTHAAGPVTITIAFEEQGPPAGWLDLTWWKSIVPQIEAANPNIKIKLEGIVSSEGDYYTKVDLMMRSASTAPDLVKEDSFLVGSDATAGYLLPLNKYLASWPEYAQQWYTGMQSITTFHGNNYGVMNGTDVRGIWYNKQIFAKAGLPTNWQPKSWADILSAARTIKAKVPGVIPMNLYSGIPDDEGSTMQGFEMLLYGTHDPLYDYQTNKWVTTSKGMKDALTFLQTVYSSKNLLGPTMDIALNPLVGNVVGDTLLPQGKLAIDLDGSWLPSFWAKTGAAPWPQWQSVMGFAKTPTEFGQAPHFITMSGGWAYSISAKSANPDAAFKVIQAANSQANLASFDVLDGQIAPRKDVAAMPVYGNVPLNPLFTSLVAFTQFRPGFPAYAKISLQIQEAMELVMNGTAVNDAVSNYSSAVQGIAGPGNYEAR
jgi:multiple sugar transport system substrate-binding protein